MPLVCSLPLSEEASDLLQHLTKTAVGIAERYAGTDNSTSVACEAMFDERLLKEERRKILQSMKVTKVDTNSLYGKFGPSPDAGKLP